MILCNRKATLFALIFFPFFVQISFAQININSSITAQALASQLSGPGIIVSNPTLNCPNFASASFKVISSNLGLDSGIVLTSGLAASQSGYSGVNGLSSALASFNNGGAGDIDLNALAGQNTHDACALEFDFIPKGDSINFQYVFSSEEYLNATCGPYNDAFAFYISGPGITGKQNMALVPGTIIPVTINSINNGVPGPGYSISNCNSMGAGSPFTSYYIDNTGGTTLTHKGLTTVLQATHDVLPCSTYHLKMVIADAGNFLYDSAVFLKAGSLQSASITERVVSGINAQNKNFIVKGCAPAQVRFNMKSIRPNSRVLHLVIGGTAVNGLDYTPITDSVIVPANDSVAMLIISGLLTPQNGMKTLQIKLRSPYVCDANNIVDSATILIYDSVSLNILTSDTALCGGDNLTVRVQGDTLFNYSWSPSVYLNNSTAKEPTITALTDVEYLLSASIAGSGCAAKTDSLKITVSPVPVVQAADISICNHQLVSLVANVTPGYPNYSYQWTGPNGFSSILENPLLTNTSTASSGNYIVKVTADTSICSGKDTLLLTITSPDTPIVTSPYLICQDAKQITLNAAGNSLLWYNDINGVGNSSAPVINATNVAAYTFYVSQTSGNCESDRVPVKVSVLKCCDGNIFIPSAFSPNNDGKNDLFKLTTSFGYQVFQINIYNRWGQLVFKEIRNAAWDGSFHDEPVPVGVYFYDILVGCVNGITTHKKGDVTLIR